MKDSVKLDICGETLYGFYPANYMFGFTYHSFMIPPFKPESMLLLGYGMGTIAELTRKIWGLDVKITGVDKNYYNFYLYDEYSLKKECAYKFVEDKSKESILTRYDYVVIDLFNGKDECDFIFSNDFVRCLEKITTKLLSINVNIGNVEKLKEYHSNFDFVKQSYVPEQMVTFWKKKEDSNNDFV